jgi:hypothetical protein
MSAKRMTVATLAGLVLGLLEALVARGSGATEVPAAGILTLMFGRGVLGFAIALSAFRIAWWLHGLVVGLIFSLPLAFGAVWVAGQWNLTFLWVLIFGLVIGFLIELFTTVIFKARAPSLGVAL